jgi:NADH-quinone oxidoreductase subunit H
MDAPGWLGALISACKVLFGLLFVMLIVPVLIWAERKGAAYIQDRPGPNRASILGIRAGGLIHTIADVVKLVFKEDVLPEHVTHWAWAAAPVIGMSVPLLVFAVIPFGDYIQVTDSLRITLLIAPLDTGLIFVLAATSLSVYSTMLAGWSSNNKFSLLGGLRASAQMISYELAMGLVVLAVFLGYGTARLDEIARMQAGPIWHWGVCQGFGIVGFPAFVVFFVAVFAEANRVPFDLPEGEAELVAGFHTEYSGLRFALFMMSEYAAMVTSSAVTTHLFWGGYNVPFVTGEALRAHADLVLVILGFGGILPSLALVIWALYRRGAAFYATLGPHDERRREPWAWAVLFGGAALAAVGVGWLGLSGAVGRTGLGPQIVAFVVQLLAFVSKVLFGCWCFIWVRWTLPRFRYDQLMSFGWRGLLPLSLVLVLVAGVFVMLGQTFTT